MDPDKYLEFTLKVIAKIINISRDYSISAQEHHFCHPFKVELQIINLRLDTPPPNPSIQHLQELLSILERWPHHGTSPSHGPLRQAFPTLYSLSASEKTRLGVLASLKQFARMPSQDCDEVLKALREFEISMAEADSSSLGDDSERALFIAHDYGPHSDLLWDAFYRIWARGCTCNINDSVEGETSRKHAMNLLLAARRPMSDTQIGFDMRISNSPVGPTPPDTQEWQDVHITLATQRQKTSKVMFADECKGTSAVADSTLCADDGISDLCQYLKNSEKSRLCMEVHEGLLSHLPWQSRKVGLLDAPGVSLRTALTKHNLSRNTRLALILIVANSFWQFYMSKWMRQPWNHDSIYFLQEYGPDEDKWQIMAQRPHLFTFFDSADQINVTSGRVHKRPHILALGILLLEIELGLDLQNEWKDKNLKRNGEPTSNTDYCTALDILANKTRWDRRTFPAVKHAIQLCLEDHFDKCQTEEDERVALYKKVVEPLEKTWNVIEDLPLEDLDTACFFAMEPKSTLELKRPTRAFQVRQLTPATMQPSQVRDPSSDSHLAAGWLHRVETELHPLISQQSSKRIAPSKPRIKVAMLDTGYDPENPTSKVHHRRNVEYHDFTTSNPIAPPCDESGHGTHGLALMHRCACHADVYIARVGRTTHELMENAVVDAINHAANVWKVDVVSMSFGFPEPVPAIKKAIEESKQSGIIYLAAASNDGRNSPLAYPAAYSDLVIPIISTNHQGQLSGFNPPPQRGCEMFATLGEDVAVLWPSHSSGVQVRSGTSTATSLAAGFVACILEYVRANVDTFEETGRPRDQIWANVHTMNGVKAILRLMATDEKNPYLAPWQFKGLGHNDQARLDTIYHGALKTV